MTSANGLVVAVVPARGGSKRIPRKNIRPFRGVPLLARTVALLRDAELFDRIVVSTDDEEIAAVAADAGAEVPFLRPGELADDHAGTRPVIVHALEALEDAAADRIDALCTVYPAAVFVHAEDLRQAYQRLVEHDDAPFVFSAAAFPAPIQRAVRERPDGTAQMFWPEHVTTRSQDLEPAYHDAGQFYWGRREAWLAGGSVLEAGSLMHVIPHWRVQDIDTLDDWVRAELVHRMLDEL